MSQSRSEMKSRVKVCA